MTSPRKEEISKTIEKNEEKKDNTDNTDSEPLDLTSPSKDDNKGNTDQQQQTGFVEEPLDLSPLALDKNKNEIAASKEKLLVTRITNTDEEESKSKQDNQDGQESLDLDESLKMQRIKFPFDDENEPYASEYEEGDDREFTLTRRHVKDELDRDLRKIDELKTEETDGDSEVLEQFETFMRNKTKRRSEEGGYLSEVSTVGTYKRALKNDLLPAFHKLFEPFDSRWILDCTTSKECTFEGEKRFYMKPEEPIYITSKIVQTALDLSKEKGGQQGGQRGTILNATIQFMNFIEIFF